MTSRTRVPASRVQRLRANPAAAADARLDLRALLDAAEAAPPAAGVDALAAELADRVGAREVSFLIADISGTTLTRLARTPDDARRAVPRPTLERVALQGTAAGQSIRDQQVQLVQDDHGVRVYAPVSERGETLGVLELLLPEEPSDAIVDYLASAAHALAYVVIADRRHSDLYELGQRSTSLSLEAEIQRRLLPPSYTCQARQFALAGWLVEADEAGGDTFDYVVGERILGLSITDAMGHGVAAALLATLAVGTLRNSRRAGLSLTEQAERASAALNAHAAPDQFVTALLVQIDLLNGAADIVNAGHMNPLLVRDGRVAELCLASDLVLGVVPDFAYQLQHFQLQAGDRLVLVTDGMFERKAAEAEIELLLGTLSDLHPREAAQALTNAVLAVTGGAVRDDATVLILDWYGNDHGHGLHAVTSTDARIEGTAPHRR
jgi:serine phosphatase RsbU (regulator of sigma subunit)